MEFLYYYDNTILYLFLLLKNNITLSCTRLQVIQLLENALFIDIKVPV